MSTIQDQFNFVKAEGWLPFFAAASIKENIPLEILLAVASRETNCKNLIGDHGHGHGICQIDDRWHKDFLDKHNNGLDPESNINYAATLLASNLRSSKGDLFMAVAGYNAGLGNVRKAINQGHSAEFYTTGKDYASDVLNRARQFKILLDKTT